MDARMQWAMSWLPPGNQQGDQSLKRVMMALRIGIQNLS